MHKDFDEQSMEQLRFDAMSLAHKIDSLEAKIESDSRELSDLQSKLRDIRDDAMRRLSDFMFGRTDFIKG